MTEELLSLKWNNHQTHFVDILTLLREQEVFIDATLACDGKLYSAHKFVLSTCSDYFKDMFTKNPTNHPIVFMKDVKTFDLEALLDFMYNGEVNVPQSALSSLIKTAESLKIKGLAVPDDPAPRRGKTTQNNHIDAPPTKRLRVNDESSPVTQSSAKFFNDGDEESRLSGVSDRSDDQRLLKKLSNSQINEPSPSTSGIGKMEAEEPEIKQEVDADEDLSKWDYFKGSLDETGDYDASVNSADLSSGNLNNTLSIASTKSAMWSTPCGNGNLDPDATGYLHLSSSGNTSPGALFLEALMTSDRKAPSEPLTCHICNKVSTTRYYYERHLKCHESGKEQCPFCPFRSTYKWNLKVHIRNKHKDMIPKTD